MTSAGQIAEDDPELLLNEIVAARAARLARAGQYAAAEDLIQPAIASRPAAPELLDLLARIRVQQGRAGDAAELWVEALAQDPGNTAFQAALKCVARNPHPAAKRIKFVCVLFAVILLLSGFEITRGRHISERISSEPPTRTPTALADLPDPAVFRSRYTTSEVRGESIEIGFARPVFARNTRLTALSKLTLADLAKRLRPFGHRLDLTIIGKTDRLPVRKPGRYSDNSVLGLLRAVAIYNELRSSIPDLAIPKLSAEQSTGAAMREAKERTATILLRMRSNH